VTIIPFGLRYRSPKSYADLLPLKDTTLNEERIHEARQFEQAAGEYLMIYTYLFEQASWITYRILLLDDDDFILAILRRELMNRPYIGHEVWKSRRLPPRSPHWREHGKKMAILMCDRR